MCILFLAGFLLLGICIPDQDLSLTERRTMHQFPSISVEKVFAKKGQTSFMDEFEKYVADQFPFRENFRTAYSAFSYFVIGRKEVNGIYYAENHILKVTPSISEEDVKWSFNRLDYINEKYLSDSNVYLSIIPDKNYYLADQNKVAYMDYEAFIDEFKRHTTNYASYIDISDDLALDSYYSTDTHWKQEKIVPVAKTISEAMGNDYKYSFEEKLQTQDFKGVYYGQGALPVEKDKLVYLKNNDMNGLKATCFDTGKEVDIPLYDFDKADEMDPYELFLSGSRALVVIDNPNVNSDKELILFRDSFGSSIAPLLAQNYKKTTLVDIRYISPAVLDRFVDFKDKDVLFLYSAQVLNNSVGQFIK